MISFKKFIKEDQSLPTIYCDLDQTLTEFLGGADKVLEKFGYTKWNDSYWKAYSNDRADEIRWAIIRKQPFFWRDLEWMSDGKALWRFIQPYNPHILSHATKYMSTCFSEKHQWVSKNLNINNSANVHIVTHRRDKQNFAVSTNGAPNILIDDHIKNVDDWKSAGGIGIHHISAAKSIMQLRKLGFR